MVSAWLMMQSEYGRILYQLQHQKKKKNDEKEKNEDVYVLVRRCSIGMRPISARQREHCINFCTAGQQSVGGDKYSRRSLGCETRQVLSSPQTHH